VSTSEVRRRLLRFLAASPLAAQASPLASLFGAEADALLESPAQALDVFDFEPVARRNIPAAHFGYLATGVDDDATLRANREGFNRYALRMRRLVDVRSVDTSVTLFGRSWETPIFLCPVSSQRAFHPEGELATARAARSRKHLQVLSTVTSTGVEDVIAARGEPVWYQLYPTDDWSVTEALVKRARAAGCTALVLTVDLQGGSNRETLERAKRRDKRDCASCHGDSVDNQRASMARKPMFRGLDLTRTNTLSPEALSWDQLARLRSLWPQPLLLKGIVSREDAALAVSHGIDGIVVSNHGGRAEESGRSAIESLPEVVAGALGRIPVLVDSGFRRGTDVFKALALGATAVGVGRPYLWGLGAFGQPGVEAVLDLLREELRTVMRQAGTRRVADIGAAAIVDRGTR
jgi:isopentenyl diphosphate isomerase/L-lactate dehydrogenase-like FMN-dependent dehydrogenase